jgi:trehalose/maltose hydrolase-like predicted phosphorylase
LFPAIPGNPWPRNTVGALLAEIEANTLDARTWTLVLDDGPESHLRVHESLLCVADGLFGTRGSLEEDGPDAQPGMFAGGLYERGEDGSETLLLAPDWTSLPLKRPLPPGLRVLDLRSGVLFRRTTSADGQVFRSARWSCLARPGTMNLLAEADRGLLEKPADLQGRITAEAHSSLGAGVWGVVDTAVSALDPPDGAPRTQITRLASYVAGRRVRSTLSGAASRLEAARRIGPLRLWEEQASTWAARWEDADVEVVGDDEVTLAARFALFQMIANVSDRGEAGLGARGLTGSAYEGHVFWDSDVFVLPALAATHPKAARAMLEYRLRRIPAARRSAEALGRPGARFPWESADVGLDVTPRSGMNEHGEVVPILTGIEEEHITADVAWAAWELASWTGHWQFLDGPGGDLLADTARYWVGRIRLDPDGSGHIDGVIGPDEYHEHVEDNAFTNQLAAWNLRRAAEVFERRNSPEREQEIADWRKAADSLVDGFDRASGTHLQFRGYEDLEPLTIAEVGTPPVAADLVLGRERLAGSQIIKQADVLMLHHMIPEVMRPGSLAADMDRYLPRTAHGSSLSPAIHASLLARLGRADEALELLRLACRIDLEDLTGTTAGGLHFATLGGIWQALVVGFAGIHPRRPDDHTLHIDTHLPEQWEELRIRIRWHSRSLRVRCQNDRVHITCDQSTLVRVGDGPVVSVAPPGAWVRRGAQKPEPADATVPPPPGRKDRR